MREEEGRGRQIRRTKGGVNTKLHAFEDAKGRPIGFSVSAGQVSERCFGLSEQVRGVFQVALRLGYAATASSVGGLK